MSTVKEIVNTVESLWDQPDITPENIVGIILAEKWNPYRVIAHEADLSFEEWDILDYWITTNRHSYTRILAMSEDMQEVFPGMDQIARLEVLAPHF